MQEKNDHPVVWIVLICLIVVGLCSAISLISGSLVWLGKNWQASSSRVGFDYDQQIAATFSGNNNAPGTIFIHRYPFPSDGNLIGVEYLNDCEPVGTEQREEVFLLILRPTTGGYQILFRQELPVDDIDPACLGTTRVDFSQPLPVQRGDLLATWQPEEESNGPIPFNSDEYSVEGRTSARSGFSFSDTTPGQIILSGGFEGKMDYFFRGIFELQR